MYALAIEKIVQRCSPAGRQQWQPAPEREATPPPDSRAASAAHRRSRPWARPPAQQGWHSDRLRCSTFPSHTATARPRLRQCICSAQEMTPANVASCIATCSHTLACRTLAIAIRGASRPLKAPEMSRARDGSHQAAARLHSAGAGIAPGRRDDALAAHGRMHVPIVPVIAGLPALLRPACRCGSGNTCPRHINRQICMPCC